MTSVFILSCGGNTHSITDPSKSGGYHTYHHKMFQVLPTECIEMFLWFSQQRARASLYISNYVVFITETDCVYCAVRTESTNLNDISLKGVIVCCGSLSLIFNA